MLQKIARLILGCASQRRHPRRIQQRRIQDLLSEYRTLLCSMLIRVAEEPAATLDVELLDVPSHGIDWPLRGQFIELEAGRVPRSCFFKAPMKLRKSAAGFQEG